MSGLYLPRRAQGPSGGLYVPGPGSGGGGGGGGGNTPSGFDMIGTDVVAHTGQLHWKRMGGEHFDVDVPLGQFPGTAYDSGYGALNGAEDTSKNPGFNRPAGTAGMYDTRKTCSVNNSVLDVWNHKEGSRPYVANILSQIPANNTYYGMLWGRLRTVCRVESVTGGGWKLANLTWSAANIWKEGEFDFFEEDLRTDSWQGFNHNLDTPTQNAWSVNSGAAASEWHSSTIEWSPGRLAFILDEGKPGQKTWVYTGVHVPSKPMVWRTQNETWLTGTEVPDGSEAHLQFDLFERWEWVGPSA